MIGAATGRAKPEVTQPLCQLPLDRAVVVDTCRPTGDEHLPDRGRTVEGDVAADIDACGARFAPTAHDRPTVERFVEPDQVSGLGVENAGDFLGCELEHLLRIAGRRHKRGDAPQRGLFGGQVAQALLGPVAVGDVLADTGGTDDVALGIARDGVAPGDLPSLTALRDQHRLVVNKDPVLPDAIEEALVTAGEPLQPDRAQQFLARASRSRRPDAGYRT